MRTLAWLACVGFCCPACSGETSAPSSGAKTGGSSTSGNSKNVLLAFAIARRMGIKTVGMTGRAGGKMVDAVDIVLRVPADATAHIQECHIAMGHIIVTVVEKLLFNNDGSDRK